MTDEVDREGAEVRQRRAGEKASRLDTSREKLKVEIARRANAGAPTMCKRKDVEPFLKAIGLKRQEARDLLSDRAGMDWTLQPNHHDKRETYVLPLGKNEVDSHNSSLMEGARKQGIDDTNCGRPLPGTTATFDTHQPLKKCAFEEAQNVAEGFVFSPPAATVDALKRLDVLCAHCGGTGECGCRACTLGRTDKSVPCSMCRPAARRARLDGCQLDNLAPSPTYAPT